MFKFWKKTPQESKFEESKLSKLITDLDIEGVRQELTQVNDINKPIMTKDIGIFWLKTPTLIALEQVIKYHDNGVKGGYLERAELIYDLIKKHKIRDEPTRKKI